MLRLLIFINLFCFISIAQAALERGINHKNKGDVIAVVTDDQIAKWCDFDKQIVVTQTSVLCVYNGNNS